MEEGGGRSRGAEEHMEEGGGRSRGAVRWASCREVQVGVTCAVGANPLQATTCSRVHDSYTLLPKGATGVLHASTNTLLEKPNPLFSLWRFGAFAFACGAVAAWLRKYIIAAGPLSN